MEREFLVSPISERLKQSLIQDILFGFPSVISEINSATISEMPHLTMGIAVKAELSL